MSSSIRATRLENGVRVVTESVADAASAALGLWVENGSRYEPPELNGVSHFLEHLLFKGTASRTAFQIVEEIEGLGGSINAFTTKEHTCYHTRTLAGHIEAAFDILADIFLNSLIREEDFELEREVILQEILEEEDSAEEYVHDYFLESYWPGHPLGWAISGHVDSVSAIRREDVLAFLDERYRPDRLIVAAAGELDHERIVDLCREHFSVLTGSFEHAPLDRPDFHPGLFVCNRDLEQVHIVAGLPGVPITDPRRETAELLMTAIGGGMSSRLFQAIREERGLAYNIYAFQSPFREIGYTGVYAATSRDHVADTVDLVLSEFAAVAQDGLSAKELERTKNQLIGSIPLALESTDSRMFRLARDQMYFGREISIEETVADIRAVTNSDIIDLAREIVAFERLGVALLGDADDDLISLPAS